MAPKEKTKSFDSVVEAVQAEDIDFWDDLSEPEKEEIRKGLSELDSDLKHDCNQVVAPFK